MGIEATFDFRKFEELMYSIPDIISEEIIRSLSYLGEQCVRRVRDRHGDDSWYDQTGNLRSSIGYAVYEHGKTMIESAFAQVKDGKDGTKSGKDYIAKLASKYAETYALVVVAGMEYADYVEAMKNKDVLASTELWAKAEADRYIQQAIDRASQRIAKMQKSLGL